MSLSSPGWDGRECVWWIIIPGLFFCSCPAAVILVHIVNPPNTFSIKWKFDQICAFYVSFSKCVFVFLYMHSQKKGTKLLSKHASWRFKSFGTCFKYSDSECVLNCQSHVILVNVFYVITISKLYWFAARSDHCDPWTNVYIFYLTQDTFVDILMALV